MSERASLVAEPRDLSGKKAKQLRHDGWIPAIIYGQKETIHVQVENLPLRRVLRDAGATHLIDINIGKERRTVLAREVQTHPTRGEVFHVDFYEVNMRQKIVVEAELVATGTAAPEAEGLGTTPLLLHSVEIECLPDNLVSKIEVDLSQIRTTEDMIHVRDLQTPEGVTVLTDPEQVVARFEYALEEEAAEEEEGMFAPLAEEVEVIKRGKQEEEFEE
ncbi:MAG: 50S ribosomal protein L25 [Chloroflexi bacterium]|nr:50S ribosomal protein L25 [Chloroflexota bacterium]MCI0580324.1 50S ribosomal protein L25 [Chloroflexota bacterium]MCI0648529.1 50S ribosomal protein L25 [Chloroflexota bacterium]MCI0728491.1 50S ribosomal protein L25 [Chloroflexota bacterium]